METNPTKQSATTEVKKELALTETKPLTTTDEKTLPQLETEIKHYLDQINQNYIDIGNNTIEIGKRLIQAKSLLKHGEWINWLQDNFQLSHPTATKFMKCAERFRNIASTQHLTSSQMIQLLSLSSIEETENFIKQKATTGNPVADMSVRTLNKEIKQWKAEKEEAPITSDENEETSTIDIPNGSLPQNQDGSVQSVSNETFKSNNDEEPSTAKTNSEIYESHLIDEFSNLCTSLIQLENRNKIIQHFAKNNPKQLHSVIQNLNTIISELQAMANRL